MISVQQFMHTLAQIEAYEDLEFHRPLLETLARQASPLPPINFYTPGFKRFQSEELCSCSSNKWPAVSITGTDCKLQCDHCKAAILKPMIPATEPQQLLQVVESIIARGAEGMLLTGGSNHRNEVEYARFLPVIERIKNRYPDFSIALHTALVDQQQAQSLASAGVDVAMLDIIGAQDTITQVYHLKRRAEDFEQSLANLCDSSMRVVPHIVIGLHYGHLLGEWQALEMVARHAVDALVLVVVMPQYAHPSRPFATPGAEMVGGFFVDARRRLPGIPIQLGCARPPGRTKQLIDAYAVMAGLNGIAHPAQGSVSLAQALGRPYHVSATCCSVDHTDAMLALQAQTKRSVFEVDPAAGTQAGQIVLHQ